VVAIFRSKGPIRNNVNFHDCREMGHMFVDFAI
jgi:hypothetical protein